MNAPPGLAPVASAPSYDPEGGAGGESRAVPQTISEAINEAHRVCVASGVTPPGHRRMVVLLKRYASARTCRTFGEWVIAYADPTGETAVRNVMAARA